ncbi:MAG: glutamate--tRNA ligase [Candidatus Taylorbacteria bacterium]|nr:glutamate--tRNA ligase [Candidatus Taylorbacteria bacterium]
MATNNTRVITRFAPSPTGFLHIGGARTALFNFLFAKKEGGSIILRLEDTDTARCKKEFEDSIVRGLAWLGIVFDNQKPLKQSERTDLYKSHLKSLVESGAAYLSKETEGDPTSSNGLQRAKRAEVIRFKNPNKKIIFHDLIRGEVSFNTADLGDFVIAKSPEEPLYHLAVVVDDSDMGVTHVIRGEDHISNTPRQILIQEALGFKRPQYAHIPLILAPDRSKLSKRHGAIALESYRDMGYLPEAMVNYLALLGWNPGTDQEIFTLAELADEFDLSKVQKSGAIFNVEKLKWFNRQYMQKLPAKKKIAFLEKFLSARQLAVVKAKLKLIELMAERTATFGELDELISSGEYDYFFGKPIYDKKILLWKGEKNFVKTKTRLAAARKLLENIPADSFNRISVKEALWPYAEKEGRGEVLWPLRVSLSGREKSPDPFTIVEILGKEETLKRLTVAIKLFA